MTFNSLCIILYESKLDETFVSRIYFKQFRWEQLNIAYHILFWKQNNIVGTYLISIAKKTIVIKETKGDYTDYILKS